MRLFLAETQLQKLQAINRNLAEYLRKQNWNYHDEPKLPEEVEARRQALAFFASENDDDHP